MKILLVLPASGKWHGIAKRRMFSGKMFRFSLLSLLTVAGLTPRKHTVRVLDEQVEDHGALSRGTFSQPRSICRTRGRKLGAPRGAVASTPAILHN